MTWHGPRGTCGCCKPCECPDGGNLSRQFTKSPTVKVVISNLPATYVFEYEVTFSTTTFYDTITIDGLDCLNGTYLFEYGIDANTGCVDWSIPLSPTESCTFNEESVFRTLSGTSGCYVASSSTTNNTGTIELSIAYYDRGFGNSGWQSTTEAVGANPGWKIYGESVAECRFDYDASLTPDTFPAGVSPFGSVTKNSSDQKIWLSWRPSNPGRCIAVAGLQTVEIGDMTIEILDL